MLNTQRELLKETVWPTKAVEVAICMEGGGAQNRQKLNQNSNTNAQLLNIVNNFQERNRKANYQQSRNDFTRYPVVSQNYQYTSFCFNCGQRWFVPQMVRNEIVVELQDTLKKNSSAQEITVPNAETSLNKRQSKQYDDFVDKTLLKTTKNH